MDNDARNGSFSLFILIIIMFVFFYLLLLAAGRSAEPLAERGALAQPLNEQFAGVKTLERYLPLTRENILLRCEDAVLIAFFIASVKVRLKSWVTSPF